MEYDTKMPTKRAERLTDGGPAGAVIPSRCFLCDRGEKQP